jgi:hypothetical protein
MTWISAPGKNKAGVRANIILEQVYRSAYTTLAPHTVSLFTPRVKNQAKSPCGGPLRA